MRLQLDKQIEHRGKVYIDLLKDEDVNRWNAQVSRGSPLTADVYLRRLGAFCIKNKTTPIKILKLTDKQRYNLLLDTITEMEKEFSPGYILSVTKVIKSWCAFMDKPIDKKVKISNMRSTPTLNDERVPEPAELRRILLNADKGYRLAAALMAFTGIRPQVLGTYKGLDGLKVGDLHEMEIQGKVVTFKKVPTIVRVRTELSKSRQAYFTFLGDEGVEYLKDYIEERLKRGEIITKDTAIIKSKTNIKPFIATTNIGDGIRQAFKRAGFEARPYILRSYFDTQMLIAESKGLIVRDYRQFWMGHTGDIEARYTTGKGRLTNETIENMRESYRKSLKYLETNVSKADGNAKAEILKTILPITHGLSEKEIANLDLDNKNDDEIANIIKNLPRTNAAPRQRVVQHDKLAECLADGWQFKGALSSGECVIERLASMPGAGTGPFLQDLRGLLK